MLAQLTTPVIYVVILTGKATTWVYQTKSVYFWLVVTTIKCGNDDDDDDDDDNYIFDMTPTDFCSVKSRVLYVTDRRTREI